MKKRAWDSKTKAKIVLEGLSGKPISEICSQYQISQNQYYQLRNKFLAGLHWACETADHSQWEEKLAKEKRRMKAYMINGELMAEMWVVLAYFAHRPYSVEHIGNSTI